jgi:filamentous hemagglutinin family protein
MTGRFHKLLLATTALVPLGLAPAAANPLGAQVVGGSATVQGQGTASVTVTQSTNAAIINWNTFNIGAGEKTNIVMPSASSVQLDRVTGGLGPSQIFGTLSSNGQVFVVNPDGILIGPGAKIDTASFLATTHDIANADFMAGRYNFRISGNPSASVVNQGTITAQSGGFAALVAPGVRNTGTITANLGTVALASGNGFTLDFYGDKLITLGLSDSIAARVKDVSTGQTLSSLVSNEGKLKANGGTVQLTAVAARHIVDSVINNTGVIEANTIGTHNGMIVLSAATAATKPAGAPAQTVKVSGKLSAAGKRKGTTGGTVQVTGEAITLAGATIDASGRAGGGTVLIGGDVGGGNPNPAVAGLANAQLQPWAVPTATTVSVDAATTLNASAIAAGNGGKVVVWADQNMTFNGNIFARGGRQSGNGGFVETSGHQQLAFAGTVDTGAPNGTSGTLLLDPQDVTIGTTGAWVVTVAAIENALASGTVVIETDPTVSGVGDITVAQSLSWNNSNFLSLNAYRNIVINSGVTITDTGAGGGLTLNADAFRTGTGTVIVNSPGAFDFSHSTGTVYIIYDPPGGYANPTNFSSAILNNPALGYSNLVAAMLVNNVNDLQNIGQNLAGYYILGKEIDASATAGWNGGAGFIPIGNATTPFAGSLNGAGVSIDGLKINSSSTYVGLFGFIGSTGIVQNVGLTNVSVTGGNFVGGLAGQNDGNIYQSFVTGTIAATVPFGGAVGGLVGINGEIGGSNAIIQSYSNATVTHTVLGPGPNFGETGGLVGQNNALIAASYSTGSTTEIYLPVFEEFSVGGLVGHNNGVVLDSYATGLVTGTNTVAGGLVGSNSALSGSLGPTSVLNSYWDRQTTGQPSDGAAAGFGTFDSTGLTTAQLKAGLPAGFDPSVWAISAGVNSGYPYLQWQQGSPGLPATFLQPISGSTASGTTETQTDSAASAQFFSSNYTNNLTLPINTTVAGSTPPVITSTPSTPTTAQPTTPATVQTVTNSNYVSLISPALLGTPNAVGRPEEVLGNVAGSKTVTWGWTPNGFTATAGVTNFAPIDTMSIVVNGQTKTLAAYANVDSKGLKYDNGVDNALNGPFQCTALISQYLSILGYKNAPAELPNGNKVASFLANVDGQYFNSSTSNAPAVGSIVSMNAPGDPAGHVAVVKGVTQENSNTIVVTLIEDNMTFQGQNTFAVNRQMTFIKGTDGTWSSSFQYGGNSFSVTGWVTPTSLP